MVDFRSEITSSRHIPANFFSPPSGPARRLAQGPPSKSKFLLMIHGVRAAFSGGLMVIIRPRGYDFLYSDEETEAMIHDIGVARNEDADGGVSEDNIGEIAKVTGVTEVHLSVRGPVSGGMTYFNPHCSMGTFSKANEYEWREASEEKIRLAKERLGQVLAQPR